MDSDANTICNYIIVQCFFIKRGCPKSKNISDLAQKTPIIKIIQNLFLVSRRRPRRCLSLSKAIQNRLIKKNNML
jgi:hypothetical protein